MREAVAIGGPSKHNLSNTLELIYCPISTRVLASLLSETTGNSCARQRAFNLAAQTAAIIRSFRPVYECTVHPTVECLLARIGERVSGLHFQRAVAKEAS